jgi:predicted ArsR family transcriptional regulator
MKNSFCSLNGNKMSQPYPIVFPVLFFVYKIFCLCYFACMNILVNDNSTRKNIILQLKKNGGMSIEELSKVIDITPMGIRQHLLALEKRGIVHYIARKRGIGRPGFIYMLTEAANDLFPTSYDRFCLGVLRDIRMREGDEKIAKIFGWRRDRLYKAKKEFLAGKESLEDVMAALKQALEEEGHFVEVTRNNGHYQLKQYHCPIHKIAVEFREACAHELMLYRELVGKDVLREQSVSEGAASCLYLIPSA